MKDKLNKIDNWRGILALIVLFSHSIQLLCSKKMIHDWMKCLGPISHISVLLFFFFSGFVIFYSIEQRFKIEKKIFLIFYDFMKARFTRIYPPLIGVLIITFIFKIYIKLNYSKLPDEFMFSIQDLINYTLMIEVSLGKINAPLWTLILEWWLYILGFLIYCILNTNTNKKIIIGFLIFIISSFIKFKINDHFLTYFVIWMIGAMFYHTKAVKFNILLLFISLCCFIYTFIYKNILFQGIEISNKPYLQILVIFSFVGFLFILRSNKILSFISSFSYSIYIIHYPFFVFIKINYFNKGIYNLYELISINLFIILLSFIFSKFFENKKRFLKLLNHLKL